MVECRFGIPEAAGSIHRHPDQNLGETLAAVIFDIDGTLADCTHRQHHLTGPGKKDWDAFYAAMHADEPKLDILQVALAFTEFGFSILLCTGRPESYRETTLAWLKQHRIAYDALFMRKDGDFRDDTIVKREMLGAIRERGYTVTLVVDDRDKVVKMWREEGLTCLQCAPGDF